MEFSIRVGGLSCISLVHRIEDAAYNAATIVDAGQSGEAARL